MVAQLNLQQRGHLCGFLAQSELRDLFERAHVFMHPSELPPDSNQEGIPNSMLEAMASGLPVVATLHGGIPEAVTDGVNGWLVPERDHEMLTTSLRRLVQDPDRWAEMGAAASQAVAAGFAQRGQIEALESTYFEALERWRARIARKSQGYAGSFRYTHYLMNVADEGPITVIAPLKNRFNKPGVMGFGS